VLMSNCRESQFERDLPIFSVSMIEPLESFLPLRYPKHGGFLRCESLISLASASLRGKRELSGEAKGLLELRL